ncbi:MAG: HlyD family efflux transporter periplasmic adaptor subunit [Acidobacteriota bacterium]
MTTITCRIGVVAFALVVGSAGCGERLDVPTATAERRDFVQRVTAEGVLQAVNKTRVSVPQDIDRTVRLAWLIDEGAQVEEGDVVARFDARAMEEKRQDAVADRRRAELKMEKAAMESRSELTGLQKDLETAELELDHAERYQRTDTAVFSRRDVLEDAIDGELARDRRHHARESTRSREAQAATQQDLLAIEKKQAQIEIDQADSGLRALEVRAPHAGIVTLVRNWNGDPPAVGAEMWRGQPIAEIPDLATMEAEVYVLEADAGGLATEKLASVVVEAHPNVEHAASVQRVEALAKPRFRGSPVQYFAVVLALDATDPATMKPGQRVRATLELDRRDGAVIIPRQAIFDGGPDGGRQVWVRRGGGFEPRTVDLGPVSMGSVVVEAGLEPGEVVALAEPTSFDDEPETTGAGGPALAAGG